MPEPHSWEEEQHRREIEAGPRIEQPMGRAVCVSGVSAGMRGGSVAAEGFETSGHMADVTCKRCRAWLERLGYDDRAPVLLVRIPGKCRIHTSGPDDSGG